jgi:predicted Zn finger-like uncharacterized protein
MGSAFWNLDIALGGFVTHFAWSGERDSRSEPAVSYSKPESCPICHSSSIVTTAKVPDADSYWRCTGCGEVWNDARRDSSRSQRGGYR